ncbi:MAG: hypothetical protein BGN88_04995 [Clostridiales bacterium 43-6]|nr:MAG: hypothetical protein BGN88_04995 [Clostridiales bacterium 43-6]
MKTFPEKIRPGFLESSYTLVMENRKADPGYRQLESDYEKLYDAIREQLGEEHRMLMLDFEAKINEIESIDHELVYLQGMIDCVALLRTIRLI